jgi:hypothetical protein
MDVFGVRYRSAEDAIKKSSSLTEEAAIKLLVFEKELYILRKERFSASRHYTTGSSMVLGTVYAYSECTIAIDVTEGKWANKPARMAVTIKKKENGQMQMMDIYLAQEDISSASSYDHFDLRKSVNIKRFEKLICKNEAEFGVEVEAIQQILARIEKFNYLIEKNLLKVEGSKFIFGVSSDDELKRVEELNKQQDGGQEEELPSNVINIFEFMHSSQE